MKKKKRYRPRLYVYVIILLAIASGLCYSCYNTWQKIYYNKKLKEELEMKYNALIEDEETLEGEVVKLQDPEYAAKYAREKFLYSKDGELIIDLSDIKDKDKDDEKKDK